MAEPVIVRLSDLRSSVERVLDLVEAQLGAEVPLQVDYYWHLPVEQAFDMTREPDAFTAGQVTDDVTSTLDDRGRVPGEAWHELAHLIGVLRALELAARS